MLPGTRARADIVFGPARLVVFVDGCFWHGCPQHGRLPSANNEWWRLKLERNAARDRATDGRFAEAGWRVVRIWEHEDPSTAADRVESALAERLGRRGHANRQEPPSIDLAPG